MDPKRIVAEGYDRIAERYAEWARRVRVGEREYYASLVLADLPAGASVLELGCGTGVLRDRQAIKISITCPFPVWIRRRIGTFIL